MKETVAAVIVTRDRLETLKKTVAAVKKQKRKVNEIIIVNNDSKAETRGWLYRQRGVTVINQGNLGSSGGQYSGIKRAYDGGHNWIWLLEDDIIPRKDALKKLLNGFDENTIRAPLPIQKNGEPLFHYTIEFDLESPFSSFWKKLYDDKAAKAEYQRAVGVTFEGALINRKVVDEIGLPEKKFFIYADDSEYFIRAAKAGFDIVVVNSAIVDRQYDYVAPDKFTWKNYYVIRNAIAIDVMHGKPQVRYLRPFRHLVKWLSKSRGASDVATTLKAFADGYFYKSENVKD